MDHVTLRKAIARRRRYVCNNCSLKFHSALINEVAGGCNPIGVPRTIEGDQIVIKAGDLERGRQYF